MPNPRITLLALPLLLSAGCASDASGVWHFYLSMGEIPADSCSRDLSHNLSNAYIEEGEDIESLWTEEASEEYSEMEFFGAFTSSAADRVLIAGDTIFEGSRTEQTWSLVAARSETSSSSNSHATGYRYATDQSAALDDMIRGEFIRDVFTGTYSSDSSQVTNWAESDSYSEEVATEIGTEGRLPAASVGLLTTDGELVTPASNAYDRLDCDSDPCSITVADSCSWSFDVIAHKTDLTWEEFEAVNGVTQGSGTSSGAF